MLGRLQFWLQLRDSPVLWRLGNALSDIRYWTWRASGRHKREG